jgi:ABC-type branched-subunit amino acid transport system permease subunit
MVIELFSYKDSILNPLLKLIILGLFVIAVYLFYRCRSIYGGKLQFIATLLLLGGVAGVLAWIFRYEGDFYTQWKWAESIFSLVLAIITLVIAYIVRMKFKNATALFGGEQSGEQR